MAATNLVSSAPPNEKRGFALIKTGTPGRTFYRFENPLLQPFTILHGLQKGLVTEAQLAARGRANAAPPGDAPLLFEEDSREDEEDED